MRRHQQEVGAAFPALVFWAVAAAAGLPLASVEAASTSGTAIESIVIEGSVSGGSTIKGLDIVRFAGDGILVLSDGNSILGNFVGVDPTGTTRMPNGIFPNSGDGIRLVSASNNQIGSAAPADRNPRSGAGSRARRSRTW